jgi:hypothetical protein
MKTYAYIAVAFSALLAPTPIVGYESKLSSDEQETSNIRRKLSWGDSQSKKDKYLSIYCRCCGDDDGNPVDDFATYPECNSFEDKKEPARTECSCPVRNKSFGWYSPRDKWNHQCVGKIKDIAFPN